jgi:hypothetical protein
VIAPFRFRVPAATPNSGMFSKDRPSRGPGRPRGALNKIPRETKEAAVAAADELGRLPRAKWAEEANKGDPDDGTKGFFKAMAVGQLKSFVIVLARLMPEPGYDDPEIDEEMINGETAASIRGHMPAATRNSGTFAEDRPRRGRGRPPGSVNKISRALQDAAVAAVEELGRTDRDKWAKEANNGDPDDGLKGFFKVIAVKKMRTFMIVLARILPKPLPAKEPPSPSDRAAKASHPGDHWSR